LIFVKENEKEKGFVLDKMDCTLVRSEGMHKEMFMKAGLKIVEELRQPDFPGDLIDVRLYSLQ